MSILEPLSVFMVGSALCGSVDAKAVTKSVTGLLKTTSFESKEKLFIILDIYNVWNIIHLMITKKKDGNNVFNGKCETQHKGGMP